MKSLIINYDIFTDKLLNDEKVVLISDVHDIFSKEKMRKQLIKDINELNPHHISIAGDTMQGSKYSDSKKCSQLSYFLDGLAENQPVMLSLGNHDLVGLTEEGRKNFRNLGDDKKVFPLDNETITLDNFRITGFSTGRKAYDSAYHKCGMANKFFTDDWNQTDIKVQKNSSYFEELVGHAPHPLKSEYVQQNAKDIKNFDLYLTGHLHNGYVPRWYSNNHSSKIQDFGVWEMPIERNENGRITFIRPWIYTKVNLCRGMHYVGSSKITFEDGTVINESSCSQEKNIPLVISTGVNPLFGLPCSPEITCIHIHPQEKSLGSRK